MNEISTFKNIVLGVYIGGDPPKAQSAATGGPPNNCLVSTRNA